MPSHLADSAGQPWQGRHFEPHGHEDDDGSAPPALLAALGAFRAQPGSGDPVAVLDSLRDARLLVPLVAHAGDEGVTEAGLRVDKTQELSLVTVAGPDGRTVLPAFTSVEAMGRWNRAARPIPVDARRIALAAAAEGTELIVLDPASPTEFALRRPMVWALAQGTPWKAPATDPVVADAFEISVAEEPQVAGVRVVAGDPDARLAGAEVVVVLGLVPGLDQEALRILLDRVRQRWAVDPVIVDRVDSMSVRLTAVG
ncbi:SseB family protein [Herbiconiux moechotypicola]|uniref:SseB family protein n=1 Tax=Herbiconiux moechotypicola TaxID=637393 RepID=UPI00217D35F3|nr:SseB family protein [Herbiconiux moechotypicola]MCS5729898.1 SseB family protein [Herbiconiux moechotypicola]